MSGARHEVPGTGELGAGFSAMYNQAFRRYGKGVNALASGPADAAQMYSNLQGIAASPYVNSTALGRAGFGASAGFGIANPSLGGAGASAAAAQLYSPQTSMMMRQLGYGATPRAQGGNGNPLQMGSVIQSIMARAYGGQTSVSSQTLNAGLANGGHLNLNLQALGLDPSTMGPAMQMYNKLFQQGVGATQAQTMLNDAAQNKNYNGTSAQKLLSNKYGIPTSDLQKMKDSSAVQTSNTAGEMGGFDSAISQATTAVQKFDTAIGTFLKVTGLGTVMGGAHGFSGAMGAIGGGLGHIIGSGVGMLSQFGGAAGVVPGGGSAGGGGSNGSRPGSSTTSVSRSAQQAIKDALGQTGKAYVWGGDNPSVGFDCSGLIEWAYAQAGVKLPRTSQGQWAALKNRSVALNKVQAGDIVFSDGSDGTSASPGHEAMMISSKQIIEAPYTGANIRVRAYNPGEWQHAGRPSGNLTGGGGTSGANGTGNALTTTGQGNSGIGGVSSGGGGGLGLATGDYGSSSAADNVASALLGGIVGGSGGAGLTTWTGSAGGSAFGSIGNGQGSAGPGKTGGSKGSTSNVSTAGGGSPSANRALAQKMAKAMYGWTGSQWNALNKLWGTYESGFRDNAQNPGSTAYGIAQFLDSTWSGYGPKTSNPGLQIKYGLEYIHNRYRNPVDALGFELSHTPHWYGAGTDSARAGMALVGERGPELVRLSGGQQIANAGQTANILKGNAAKASQALWSSGTAQQLSLANMPQNAQMTPGKAEVNLNFPQGAIVIHTTGSATDVSNNVRQIMEGVTRAMDDNETLKKIMSGVTS